MEGGRERGMEGGRRGGSSIMNLYTRACMLNKMFEVRVGGKEIHVCRYAIIHHSTHSEVSMTFAGVVVHEICTCPLHG